MSLAQSIFQYIHTSLISIEGSSSSVIDAHFQPTLQNAADSRCDLAVRGTRQLQCLHSWTLYLLGSLQGIRVAVPGFGGLKQQGTAADATLHGGQGDCGLRAELHQSTGGHQVSQVPESRQERSLDLSANIEVSYVL